MKRFSGLLSITLSLIALFAATPRTSLSQNAQQLAFAGLRAAAGKGQFNSVQADSAGNLYLLYDQKDGVRILKTDPGAVQLLAQAQFGAAGDAGIAMALDPAGNVYVTGTTTSGTIAGTSGVVFPARADASTNSFVAKFDSNLNPVFVTYSGSGRTAVTAIAATADAVFITGSIFANTLPVTPSAIIQSPASGSFGNGFVERFNATGTSLVYATYLSGFGGDTAPAALTADAQDNAYIAGYTTSSGYPTLAAVVPTMIGMASGFLSKLGPAGDSFVFSTFIPGSGVTSLALDSATQTLLFSGTISRGQFPIATVTSPLVSIDYQTAVRMPLDGSRVLSSTLLAPGTQSVVAPAPNGAAWAALTLTTPLLPLPAISGLGDIAAFRIAANGAIDQSIRLGGHDSSNTALPKLPSTIASIAVDSSGQPIFAGAVQPVTSSSQIPLSTYDLPLLNAPTSVLPSALRDAAYAGTCSGSICTGSGAYLAKFTLTSGPSLALSTDTSPNITLRNLGSAAANNLQIATTGFTLSHNCPTQFGPGEECSIVLTGSGPGTITALASNAAAQTVNLPAAPTRIASPFPFSPREIDFGIVTPSTPQTRTITITNLAQTPVLAPFTPPPPPTAGSPLTLTSDCPPAPSQYLPAGATCHLFQNISVPAAITSGRSFSTSAGATTGVNGYSLTAYLDPSALNLSSTRIDFGTQFSTPGSLRLPRFLYISNNSAAPIQHSPVALGSSSPFTVTDRCPTLLDPHTVCQLQVDYLPQQQTSSDSVTLALDQGLSVLVTGQTIPQPGAGGATVNPSLTVTPTSINFPNTVVVTGTSPNTQTATILNAGAQPFPLTLSLTGDFTDSTNCPSVLAAGTSCSAVISFAPSQPGARQGLLAVSSGAGTTPTYITLTGTATAILASNNGTLDLGSTAIGQPVVQWYKITQSISQFAAATSGSFGVVLVEDIGYGHGQPPSSAFTASAVGSCFNCWLGVQFLPAAAGSTSAALTLASSSSGSPYTLTLTGAGLPLTGLILTPTQQDFGPVAVHSSSAPTLFTLTNLTPTTANLSAPATTGDFTISNAPSGGATCGGPLAPNASCFVQVAYVPTATGPATGSLTIASDTASATAALTAYGLPDPGFSLNPDALVFRNVPGPTATQQTITLANTGIYNLQIAAPTSTSVSFQPATTCGTLTPGATCTIAVTFVPSSATVTGTLSIPVTSSAAGSPQTTFSVALTGAYTIEDTGLQILPSQAVYGPTPTSTLGLTRQFTINNLTAKPLTLALSLPRQFVLSQPPCAALAPNASCNFSVTFLPLTNGSITGTLFAQATPTDGSATRNGLAYVEGFGIGSGSLAISGALLPSRLLNFGQLASGQTTTRTLTLTNSGNAPLTIRRVTSEWPFLATTTCGATLAPAQSCTAALTYSPINQVAQGYSPAPFNTDAGTLVIESDAVSSPDFIDLTGTVTPFTVNAPSNTAPLVSYTVSQSSLTFSATSGGNASALQTVTLANTGTATIHVTALSTTPDFTVTSPCATVVPGSSCPITVAFTPQASSSQTITTVISALEIASDSSSALDFISLLGTATPPTLTLSPVALDFGAVLVGTTATLPIQVTNGSSNPATLGAIAATGDYTVTGNCPSQGSQLPPASSCTLQVTFAPTQAGTRTGTVSIASSLTTLPLTVNLTGSGAQSRLQITPASLTFDNTVVGASAKLTLSLANTGTAPVRGIALSVAGDYAVTSPCAATTLVPGASCAITVTFTPTAAGTRTGSLSIASSDPSSPLAVSLTGTGTPAGAISLTVDGGASSSLSVTSGRPANYNLSVTPLNGYTGAVVLHCTPVTPGQYAACSLLPSSITLSNTSPQTSIATINTVTEQPASARKNTSNGTIALCLLPFGILLFRRSRATLAIALLAVTALFANGCGSGGNATLSDPNLRYTPPGAYQYQVTATTTSGAQLSQTVTLNLTVTAR
ncbi:MAG: choice-of-anchor D domain-containing protein [Acidobacteria bacterium]|nr:choice-of-anchor D domain-containing protein [Acidobacteriota bacterium]